MTASECNKLKIHVTVTVTELYLDLNVIILEIILCEFIIVLKVKANILYFTQITFLTKEQFHLVGYKSLRC